MQFLDTKLLPVFGLCLALLACQGTTQAARADSGPLALSTLEQSFSVAVHPVDISDALKQIAVFKKAVTERDCHVVARMTQFPVNVNSEGVREQIRDEKMLCECFDFLFDDQVTHIVKEQEPLAMGAGYRGLMFGTGQVWLQPSCSVAEVKGQCADGKYVLKLVAFNR